MIQATAIIPSIQSDCNLASDLVFLVTYPPAAITATAIMNQ